MRIALEKSIFLWLLYQKEKQFNEFGFWVLFGLKV